MSLLPQTTTVKPCPTCYYVAVWTSKVSQSVVGAATLRLLNVAQNRATVHASGCTGITA